MMEFTTLLKSAAITENSRFHLLMEGGAQNNENSQVFYAEHSAQMHSLYLHPQLADIRNYGPWVFAVQDKNDLGRMMETIPGIVGVIASPDSSGLLAARLSVACTMIRPDEEVRWSVFIPARSSAFWRNAMIRNGTLLCLTALLSGGCLKK